MVEKSLRIFKSHFEVSEKREDFFKNTTDNYILKGRLGMAGIGTMPLNQKNLNEITDETGYEPIRVWVAPKAGVIQINDVVNMVASNSQSVAKYSIETSNPSINNSHSTSGNSLC